jgi:hypothetical protein
MDKFRLLDTDGDDYIDVHELHNGISTPGIDIMHHESQTHAREVSAASVPGWQG